MGEQTKRAPYVTGRVLLAMPVPPSIVRTARWTVGQVRGCLGKDHRGKVQHATREDAMRQRASLLAAGKADPKRLAAYECRVCGFWHVGNRGGKYHRGGGST